MTRFATIKGQHDDFGNIKDNNDRLNEHTQVVLEELADLTRRMKVGQIDSRALYAGLKTFNIYYRHLGESVLGIPYMEALDAQARKLANEMLTRDV
jgi:hypothetical protein